MKIALAPDEEESVKKILGELVGFNVKQAEMILKEVAAQLKERAVIEEAD